VYDGPPLVYDDSATLRELGVQYKCTVASSLPATVEALRASGQLDKSLL
jgi:hypothetical protein